MFLNIWTIMKCRYEFDIFLISKNLSTNLASHRVSTFHMYLNTSIGGLSMVELAIIVS